MKKVLENTIRIAGGREVLLLLALTFTGYIILERTGLFRTDPASYRVIFNSMPSKILSILIAIHAAAALSWYLYRSGLQYAVGPILFYVSLLVLTAGLWTSIFTRFEGKAVRSPGQTFNGFKSDYVMDPSFYMTRYSKMPGVGILFGEPVIETSPDMKKVRSIEMVVSYAGSTTGDKILGGKLTSRMPMVSDWTLMWITDLGYEMHYILYNLEESVLEERQLDMGLFPPGTEESFDTMFLGYVFYVRCYPDYVDENGLPRTRSPYTRNPACNLRITRNKDIVFSGILRPENKVRFDNYIMALPGLRPWVEVSFVRDLGLPVVAAGLVLMTAGVLTMAGKRRKGVSGSAGDAA